MSAYQLYHPSNRQNDPVWAHTYPSEVVTTETVKHSKDDLTGDAIPGADRSRRYPRDQTVTTSFYRDTILETALRSLLSRTREDGPPTTAKLHPVMFKVIFQQDGAPAHTAATSQQWCEEHLPDSSEVSVTV